MEAGRQCGGRPTRQRHLAMADHLRDDRRTRDGVTGSNVALLVAKFNENEESKHKVSGTSATPHTECHRGKRDVGSPAVTRLVGMFNKLSLTTSISSNRAICSRSTTGVRSGVKTYQKQLSKDPIKNFPSNSDSQRFEKTDRYTWNPSSKTAGRLTSVTSWHKQTGTNQTKGFSGNNVKNTDKQLTEAGQPVAKAKASSQFLAKTIGLRVESERMKNKQNQPVKKTAMQFVEETERQHVEETAEQPATSSAGQNVTNSGRQLVSQLVEKIASQPEKNTTAKLVKNATSKPAENDTVSQPVKHTTTKPAKNLASRPVENTTSNPVRLPMLSIVIDFWVKLYHHFAKLFMSWMVNSNHPFHLSHRWVAAAVRSTEKALFWLPAEPLWHSLQTSHVAAAGECPTCSPLSRLSVQHYNQSGSSAEGLDDLDEVNDRQSTSDIDMMMELGPCRVIDAGSQGDQPASADPVQAGCEESSPLLLAVPSERPGFVVLLVEPTAECDHKDRRQFSAEAVRQLVQDWCGARHSPDDIIVTSGPAVNVSRPGQEDGGIDWVPCLRMLVWPSEEFRSRQRVTDFPPAEVRQDIYRFGVHLVPTGHSDSPDGLMEFRVSFSRAELVTCWHLFPAVRVAVLGLKYVKYIETYRKKMQDIPTTRRLKSYHIKTAAFWLSQDTPREHWTDPIRAMHTILDKLEEAFKKRKLPCFFWAEVNLLAESSEEDCAAIVRQILAMRKNILQHLLSWYSITFDLQWWMENDNELLLEIGQGLSLRNKQRHTENAHSLSENQQPSSESQQPSSESQQPSSDWQQPSSDSQQPSSESQQPSSESQQPSSDSQQPSSVPTFSSHPQRVCSRPQRVSSRPQRVSSHSQTGSSRPQTVSSRPQRVRSHRHTDKKDSLVIACYEFSWHGALL